jgi:hypothetical protein
MTKRRVKEENIYEVYLDMPQCKKIHKYPFIQGYYQDINDFKYKSGHDI